MTKCGDSGEEWSVGAVECTFAKLICHLVSVEKFSLAISRFTGFPAYAAHSIRENKNVGLFAYIY